MIVQQRTGFINSTLDLCTCSRTWDALQMKLIIAYSNSLGILFVLYNAKSYTTTALQVFLIIYYV